MALPKFVYSLLKKTDTTNNNVTNPKLKGVQQEEQCDPPPFHLANSVWELQASGIKLRPRMAARFTDINFNNGMVGIPSLTIDDLFFTILINGVAFEHSSKTGSKDLTAYVSFMSRLITCPTDVKILCSNGIISGFSHNDLTVVEFFHSLWLKIGHLDTQHSYLSERLKKLECYLTRRWSWRTLLFCITNLLFAFNSFRVGVNLMIHLVQQVRFIGKFRLFFFPNFVIVIIMFMVCESPIPALTVDEQVIEYEDSFTVDEQVEDSVTVVEQVDEQVIEYEDSVTVNEQVEDSVTVDEQVEDSVTVVEQVEDSVMVDEQHVEAEDQQIEIEDSTKRRDTRRVTFLETVSGEKYETMVDCVSLETAERYYNEPWRRVLENEAVWVLVSALRVV